MSIVIDDGIRGIFFLAAGPVDFLVAVTDDRETRGFRMTLRIRYYADDRNPLEFHDRKEWFTRPIAGPLETVFVEVRDMLRALARGISEQLDALVTADGFELIRGDGTVDEFVARLQASRFAHSRVIHPTREADQCQ